MPVYRLKNTIQNYVWGSKSSMSELLGIQNADDVPMAELWMGAHPKASSRIVQTGSPGSLYEAINENPAEYLGAPVANRFGGALPFLFKVLAAESALSIQAHPAKKQAEEGYSRENAAEVSIDATDRNYRDDNHKPEIICPLTEYWALCGFRTIDEISERLGAVKAELIERALQRLLGDASGSDEGLAGFLETLLTATKAEQKEAIDALVESVNRRDDDVAYWICELNRQFPGDIGVAAPTFLNLVRLSPGEAVYLPAGILHAYLHGTGIELMANSDNVLRGGLTVKHVDVHELTRTLVFEPFKPAIIEPVDTPSGWNRYPTPAAEFELSKVTLALNTVILHDSTPSIVLCLEGEGSIGDAEDTEPFLRGDSFFVSAGTSEVHATGTGTLYRASVP